ncbi:MAG: branched-chain amino acid ABC transporter permease [Fimbriimonadaceae bacterium]
MGLHLVGNLDFSTLPQQLVFGIMVGAIYALLALGYTMVYGVLRLINFAHGEVYMLGAYVALFASWSFGFTPEALRGGDKTSSIMNLFLMLILSMAVCAIVGITIEFLAYRPMRNQPRIAALITAIGVSLLLQYGGALFLPVSPPPAISEQVNPFRGVWDVQLSPKSAELGAQMQQLEAQRDATKAAFDEQLKLERSRFDLSERGIELRNEMQQADREYSDVQRQYDSSGVDVKIPKGQTVMLLTAIVLMLLLRWLVMKTRVGRGMRAVSHDFDSASLMGVNVGRIVMITFFIGSALAGAGAMMTATFIGTPITTFYGLQPGVKAFTAAVLGGIGSIPGAVLGGLLMGVAETMVVWAGGSSYKDAVALVILIVVLLFRPSGLLGSAKVEKV